MTAGPNTRIQANVKTVGDTLVNFYADTPDEFERLVDWATGNPGVFATLESSVKQAVAVGQVLPVQSAEVQQTPPSAPPTNGGWGTPPAAAPQQGGWAQPAPAPQAGPSCQHGPRTARKGNGSKGEWRAWMCPTPKGTPGQCEPEWVRKGSPEWNTFPA